MIRIATRRGKGGRTAERMFKGYAGPTGRINDQTVQLNLDDEPGLIEASRRGDSEAFAQLIARYQKMIHVLTYRMSGSEADAADLAQEAFVQAWRHLQQFRGASRFSSWLYRITMNLCLNWQARQTRESAARAEWSSFSDLERGSREDRRVGIVQEALMKLPAKQRAAIILTVYDGLNHEQAGRVLGCSETTVSWRVFVARGKLRRWIERAIQIAGEEA